MFNNDLFSDIKFVVKSADGLSESQVIPAHKLVLSISSPVFEAMFHGELAEARDSIELPDCEYESLLELLRYMYSDEVILNGNNVMGVLYLAKKYIVPLLAEKCTGYLQDHLHPSNVFSILPSVQKYNEKNLVDRCWKEIDKQTEEAVKSDGFGEIERCLLEAVVERDTLTVKEVNLFKAVNLWATKECERQGLKADGEVKRRILGESIIKGIRYPVMNEAEFASVVVNSKILTPDEIITFFKYYSSPLNSSLEFLKVQRSGFRDDNIHSCGRFDAVLKGDWNYGRQADGIDFTVDRDIMLHGLCLFGSENNDYSVALTIKKDGRNPALSKEGTFSSRLLKYDYGNYYGFEVLFHSAVKLKKNTRYQITGFITGPPSWYGENGVSTVVCSGVTFTFLRNENSHRTGAEAGQFPEILFSK